MESKPDCCKRRFSSSGSDRAKLRNCSSIGILASRGHSETTSWRRKAAATASVAARFTIIIDRASMLSQLTTFGDIKASAKASAMAIVGDGVPAETGDGPTVSKG